MVDRARADPGATQLFVSFANGVGGAKSRITPSYFFLPGNIDVSLLMRLGLAGREAAGVFPTPDGLACADAGIALLDPPLCETVEACGFKPAGADGAGAGAPAAISA